MSDKELANFVLENVGRDALEAGGFRGVRHLAEEMDPEQAKARAVTSREQYKEIFDKLKPKQTLWISYSAVMSTESKEFRPYTVGRRSHSKKYNVTSVTITPRGQKPGRFMKFALRRRGDGDVGLALGDMAASILGMYLEK